MHRSLRHALAVLTLLALIPAPASATHRAGGGLTEVARIAGTNGTDLEFLSRTLTTYRAADGSTVTPAEAVVRHFAVVGNLASNTRIVDITNPEAPYVAAEIPCTLNQGDVQVNAERNLVVIANGQSSSRDTCTYVDATTGEVRTMPPGAAIVDISDLYAPKVVAAAPHPSGVGHNTTLDPSGRYLYISRSGGSAPGSIPIYDLADIRRPRLVQNFALPSGDSPHDIRFNAAGTRAYAAGVDQFRILDTTDLEAPKVISTFNPPTGTIGHDTLVSDDGAFMFAGDEANGGSTFPCPGGAIAVYDIRNETSPKLLGHVYAGVGPVTDRSLESPTDAGAPGSCTSHVMAMNPDGRSFTIAWYKGGTRVFDFSGLYDAAGNPRPPAAIATYGARGLGGVVETGFAAPDGANTWSAKQYAEVPGYIFADDLALGFYVLRVPE